jgi:hypothetical protein
MVSYRMQACRLAELHTNRMYHAGDVRTCSIAIDRLCSKYRIFAPRFTGPLLRGFASRLDGQCRRRCRLFHPALSVNRTNGDADPSVQPRRRMGHCSSYSLAFQCRCNHVTVRGKMRQCSDSLVLAQTRLRFLDKSDISRLEILGRSCALVCRNQVADNHPSQQPPQSCPRNKGPISWLASMLARRVQ